MKYALEILGSTLLFYLVFYALWKLLHFSDTAILLLAVSEILAFIIIDRSKS